MSLPYESKCSRLHGHNWTITVFLASREVNAEGMVIDFKRVKEKVHDYLDHGNFNDLLAIRPSLRSRTVMWHKPMTTIFPSRQNI